MARSGGPVDEVHQIRVPVLRSTNQEGTCPKTEPQSAPYGRLDRCNGYQDGRDEIDGRLLSCSPRSCSKSMASNSSSPTPAKHAPFQARKTTSTTLNGCIWSAPAESFDDAKFYSSSHPFPFVPFHPLVCAVSKVADAGHAPWNSRDCMTASGTASRDAGRKPEAAK